MSDWEESMAAWLTEHASSWRALSKREFIPYFSEWRRVFEPSFARRRPDASGYLAMLDLEARLPADVVLFCEPRYRYLPSGTAHRFFAFCVTGLRSVDRDLFNDHDVTVADSGLRYCCFYTHEIGSIAEPAFWLVEGPVRIR